ncbi:hypothetical protein OIDMADRAFT_183300 [Oidiodendron maius Zn]|uniref:Ketoreductase (KR) domain-containing protein n=1 Tax=Oidiodendron maius (strain Zn) TaxID=913774 RepID=A0A0C3GKA6_OIDMZ|nr:hypothetical protein OIDMADRAFT_183300 [Oidiodendron maius Zn]
MAFPSITKTWHNAPYAAIDPTRPELSVARKNVLVTGGVIGIGASTVYAFAKAGASSVAILGHIINKVDVDRTFEDIVAQIGLIDIGVHNTAYMSALRSMKDADADEWWKAYEVNVLGSFNVISVFLKKFFFPSYSH